MFERHAVVIERIDGPISSALNQAAKTRIAREIRGHHHGVQKIAEKRAGFRTIAAGRHAPDRNALLA